MKITDLKPSSIYKYFDQILEIPRPSKQEEKIILYLENFALKHDLEFRKDKAGNIVIRKPAAKGFENLCSVVLQSHIDMVCEKNNDVSFDFTSERIPAYIEGDWIKAKGTTLGADNGIGIAAQLAILEDKSISHGPLECLFTVDEETGLTGARELEQNLFTGKILINLDSEDDGEIFIGCAGGIDTIAEVPLQFEDAPSGYIYYDINLTGLKGGHSGDDINKGFANSNILLARFLWNSSMHYDLRLCQFNGGNLRNAIPREAKAIVCLNSNNQSKFEEYLVDFLKIIQSEYSLTEPGIRLDYSLVENVLPVLTKDVQNLFLNTVYSCPNGVVAMSQTVPGLVETSTNLASVHFNDKIAKIVTSQRSSVDTAKTDIADKIKSNFKLAKANVLRSDSYPGWMPNPKSTILSIAETVFENLFHEKAKVKAVHAGLECGLFLDMYPDLDMISIGPTIRGVHSPDERMQISTVVRFWDFLLKILENIPIAK
jgi:dipeptidase D